MKTLRRSLASNAHNAWARWTAHLLNQCTLNDDGSMTIPSSSVFRWQSQISTSFDELSVQEQASDLREADLILKILRDFEKANIQLPCSGDPQKKDAKAPTRRVTS